VNVAVVIVTYNNSAATLTACLDALAKQTLQPTRTLVIDNASPQGFPVEATANRHNVEVIRNNENVGFAAANNQAFEILARDGSVELVALLNPDAFPEPGWLAELVGAAEQYPEFDAFASRMMIEGTDDIVDGMGDAYHITGLAWREGHGTRLRPTDLLGREVFGVCAGAGLYRLAALVRVRGFDEGLFCYLEDIDLSFRMRRAGMRCRYVPGAVVWHVGGQSSQDNVAFRLYYGHRNMIRVYLKNMPAALLMLTLPAHVVVNLVGVVRSLWRGDASTVWRAKLDATRSIRHVWGQRRELSRSATIGARPLWRHLSKALHRRIAPVATTARAVDANLRRGAGTRPADDQGRSFRQ
jgi:GT2 family glycosyltransferase